MEDELIELLSSFTYPVMRQGSLAEDDAYPSSFFTFWNTDSPDHSHYDNKDYGTSWTFQVYFYSDDPELTYSVIADARALLKANGWVVPSRGFDVYSDEPTHTGRGLEVYRLSIPTE